MLRHIPDEQDNTTEDILLELVSKAMEKPQVRF